MDRLRLETGRDDTDRALILFELALAEIGANVLLYGRPKSGPDSAVEYELELHDDMLEAQFADLGPPPHNQLAREMPEPLSESGRGLAIARQALDELVYSREGKVNRWRLVKRL